MKKKILLVSLFLVILYLAVLTISYFNPTTIIHTKVDESFQAGYRNSIFIKGTLKSSNYPNKGDYKAYVIDNPTYYFNPANCPDGSILYANEDEIKYLLINKKYEEYDSKIYMDSPFTFKKEAKANILDEHTFTRKPDSKIIYYSLDEFEDSKEYLLNLDYRIITYSGYDSFYVGIANTDAELKIFE